MTFNVRLGGILSEFVSAKTGKDGASDNVGEFVRDLIRRDKLEGDQKALERLKAEVQRAFAAPETDYKKITAEAVINRNRSRRSRP